MKKKNSIDMVHGPLLGKILLFSFPLMATNILQMLFNAADMVIVGRYAGYESLAAVGSTTFVVSLFVNTLVSLSVGVNVVIARYIGLSNREQEVSRALHTAITVALIGGVFMCALGLLASEWMLQVTNTPLDVRPLALIYIRIYFLGTPLTMIYNFGAAAMRASGDTRRPLLYLSISGALNVLLNLLFVIVLQMNVAGVALATVISQGVSAALILGDMMRAKDMLHFSPRELCIDKGLLREMAYIGVPAGLQSSMFSLSNIVIQSAVNAYGSVVIAGYSAATSVEGFLVLSMNAFTQACQTFVSQNYGAGNRERIGRIVRICLLCILVVGILQSALSLVFAHPLIGIYNNDAAIIEAGVYHLYLVATFYVIYGIADGLMGAVRGCGVSIAPVVINLLGTCLFRLIWIALLDTSAVGVGWVYVSFPISWVLITVFLVALWAVVWKKLRHKLPVPAQP